MYVPKWLDDIIKLVQDIWAEKPIELTTLNEETGKSEKITAKFNPELSERSDLAKIAFGNKKGTGSERRMTLDLAPDFYQIAQDARYTGGKTEVGKENPAHAGVKRWEYFVTNLVYEDENGAQMDAHMNIDVKQKDDGTFFYSFGIEKGTAPQTLLAVVDENDSSTVPKDSISQNNPDSQEKPAENVFGPNVLPTAKEAMEQARRKARAAKAKTETERTGILLGADEGAIHDAVNVSNATGIDVRFYRKSGEKVKNDLGYYNHKDGRIYINADIKDPIAFIFGHEMVHHIQSADKYIKFFDTVIRKIQEDGGNIREIRRELADRYAESDVILTSPAQIDQEVVAEYAQKHLFTDAESITSIVGADKESGRKILGFLDKIRAKFGNADVRERVFIDNTRKIYAKALQETAGSNVKPPEAHGAETAEAKTKTEAAAKQPAKNARQNAPAAAEDGGKRNPFSATVLPTAAERFGTRTAEENNPSTTDAVPLPLHKGGETAEVRAEESTMPKETEPERGKAIYDGLTEEEYDAMADVQEAEDSMAGHSMLYEDGRQYSIAKDEDTEGIFSAPREVTKKLSEQVSSWLQGRMRTNEHFVLGKTPEAMKQLGAQNLPIVMNQSVMVKITGGSHAIALDVIKEIPNAMADPVMIFKSDTVKNAFVILTEFNDKSGDAVVVALHLNKEEKHIRVNRVASIYGKEKVENFIQKQTAAGNLKYIDKNKSQAWSQSRGLQLPKLADTNPDNNIVLYKENVVNRYRIKKSGKYASDKIEKENKGDSVGENKDQNIQYSIAKDTEKVEMAENVNDMAEAANERSEEHVAKKTVSVRLPKKAQEVRQKIESKLFREIKKVIELPQHAQRGFLEDAEIESARHKKENQSELRAARERIEKEYANGNITEEEYNEKLNMLEAEESMAGHSTLYEDGRQYSIQKRKGVANQNKKGYNKKQLKMNRQEYVLVKSAIIKKESARTDGDIPNVDSVYAYDKYYLYEPTPGHDGIVIARFNPVSEQDKINKVERWLQNGGIRDNGHFNRRVSRTRSGQRNNPLHNVHDENGRTGGEAGNLSIEELGSDGVGHPGSGVRNQSDIRLETGERQYSISDGEDPNIQFSIGKEKGAVKEGGMKYNKYNMPTRPLKAGDTFPPSGGASRSEANQLATMWAHKEDVKNGERAIVTYHGQKYTIVKDDSTYLRYTIERKLTKKGYELAKRYYGEVERYEINRTGYRGDERVLSSGTTDRKNNRNRTVRSGDDTLLGEDRRGIKNAEGAPEGTGGRVERAEDYARSIEDQQNRGTVHSVGRGGRRGGSVDGEEKQYAIAKDAGGEKAEGLPRKAQAELTRAEKYLAERVGEILGVPKHAQRDFLHGTIRDISEDYLQNGAINRTKADTLFEEAYRQGVVVSTDYYEQYKHVLK